MAKQLSSRYLPGKRSPAWKKIKPTLILPCLIIGYRPGRRSIRAVLVATVHEGVLRYVGEVNRGFSAATRADLVERLVARPRSHPLVPRPARACWVEPVLYCRVRFQEWTVHGRLRHAVFDGWIAPDRPPVCPPARLQKARLIARNPLELA
jgi:ATP-dependent DNA ligase